MKFKPLNTGIVYKHVKFEKATKSGLTLSEFAFYGRVAAVGPGDGKEPMRVREGDLVLLHPWQDGKGSMSNPARSMVYIGDEAHYVCDQKDVAAVVEE